MSDIYYKWVNDVVEQVREEYPDKWFGLLAYNDVTDPPSFKLDDHVVPFITKDRLTWIDDDIEDYGHYQMEEWEKVANNIGWYDYMYGTFYMVPRVFPHKMAETFQYAKEHNVIGDYIEMYHNAGDGPKAWLAAKLMWDSDQDVDALMQEWYERTVGVEAASDLAELYDHWEDFWTNRIKESNWFQNGKTNTYLPFKQQTYLNLVTDGDIEQSMNLISSVVDKAQTDEQKTRAEKIQKMFKYYEATALSYPREGDMEAPKDEAEALELVETIADTLEAKINFASKRAELKEEFEDDPALKFRSSRWYEWSGTNGSEFWNVADYIRDHESDGGAVTDRMNELAGDDQSLNLREFAELVLAVTTGEMRSLTGNPSYEEGEKDAPPWNFWDPSGTATIERVEGTSHTGDSSVLIENATDRSGTHQTFKIQPGKTAAQMHYYTPEGTETDGFVRIVVSPQSEDGETLADYISSEKSLSDSAGEWSSVGVFEDIPTEINGKKVDKVLLNAQVMNAPDTKVYLDDVGLYQSQILTRNSSFEEGDSSADAWNSWIKHSGSIQRVEDKAHSGEASLLVDQLERGGPHQNFNVGSGLKKVQIYYYPVDGTEKGTIQLTLHVRNEDGDELKSLHTEETELFESVEEWASIDFLADIPEKVDGEPVADAKVVAVIDGAEDSQVYLDDFEVRNAVNVE